MQRLTIVIYHRVLAEPDPVLPDLPDAAAFERQLRLLGRFGRFLPLGEAISRLHEGRLPGRSVCITFDDGYADNAEVALPVLRRLGCPATFFVTTGYIGGGCMFNDWVIEAARRADEGPLDLSPLGLGRHAVAGAATRRALADAVIDGLKYRAPEQRMADARAFGALVGLSEPRLMMDEAQVRTLHGAGMEIGGHTVTHPILARIAPDAAEAEIRAGKRELERIIEAPVDLFAYPNGRPGQDYGPEHVAMVKAAGFRGAVSTARGVATATSDRFQLPRFSPWPRAAWRLGVELLRNLRLTGSAVA